MQHLLAALALLLTAAHASADPQPLPALNIDIKQTSVSGVSSGGYLAVQFQVAHSSIVKGAGIIAAGPWDCAQGDVVTATTKCSCTLEPTSSTCKVSAASTNVPALVAATRQAAAKGLIDDPANLARQRVYTFAGGKDGTVPKPVVAQLGDYYRAMGLPHAALNAVVKAEAGHTMPTVDFGEACGVTGEPYIGQCGVDGARDILSWIYGPLKARQAGTPRGKFVQFDQRPYQPKLGWFSKTGMDDSGWLYVPEACAKGQPCRLHIALHGCRQGQSYLPLTLVGGGSDMYYGVTFVKHAGYDTWADENHLVILFPQAVTTWNNPNGCWDWWGYTDAHYADTQGVQIRALRAMADRLSSGAH